MKKNAIVHEVDTNGHLRSMPCWVIAINENDIFPVKYKYKGRGYSKLIFSTFKHWIEIL